MTTTHYRDSDGNYIGGFGDGATPPDGAIQCPAPTRASDTWNGSAWVASVEAKRAAATITRAQFLKGCVSAGIITADVAEAAATGEWPAAFNTFLSGLTRDQRIEAKATWADAKEVRRTAPILALIAADQQVSEAQLDALFGIS